jgi:hypothetical protein
MIIYIPAHSFSRFRNEQRSFSEGEVLGNMIHLSVPPPAQQGAVCNPRLKPLLPEKYQI